MAVEWMREGMWVQFPGRLNIFDDEGHDWSEEGMAEQFPGSQNL